MSYPQNIKVRLFPITFNLSGKLPFTKYILHSSYK